MLKYCQNKKTATVAFVKKDGTKGQIKVEPAPVEVECGNGQGKYIYDLKTSGFKPNTCIPDGGYQFGGQRIADLYQLGTTTEKFSGVVCSYVSIKWYVGDKVVANDVVSPQYKISKVPNPNTGNRLIVKDGNGKTVLQEDNVNCELTKVSCDDECPPDHIRCETNRYPGHCCIPCKSTASKIDNLASRIK